MSRIRRFIILVALIVIFFSLLVLLVVDTIDSRIPTLSVVVGTLAIVIIAFMQVFNRSEPVARGEGQRRQSEARTEPTRPSLHHGLDYPEGMMHKLRSKKISFIDMEYTNVARLRKQSAMDTQTYSSTLQLYASHTQFVLIGLPGVGKSTVLREMFCTLAEEYIDDHRKPIPLWIDLSDPGNPTDAQEMFSYWCEKYNLDITFDKLLNSRPLVLLLDGLNEMPLQNRRERARSLSDWLEKNDDIPAIITCRVRDYQDDNSIYLGRKISQVYVEPFEEAQIKEFLDATIPEEMAERLMREIKQDDALLHLAQIPLHLGMLTELSLWRQDQLGINRRLPKRTKTLFREYLKARYDYENQKKQIYLKWETLEKKLEKLAFKMIAPRSKKGKAFSPSERKVKRILGPKAMKDADNLYLLTRNVSSDDDDRNYTLQFFHQSFHGYFALPRLERSLDLSYNQWWMPHRRSSPGRTAAIIRQIGDMGDTAEIAVDTLLPLINDEDPDIQKASVNALIDIGIPAITPLVQQLGSEDELLITNSTEILCTIGEPILGPLLIHALKNEDVVARRHTADILERLNLQSDVPQKLISVLRDSETHADDVKGYVGSMLGEIRSSRAVQPLIPLLRDPDNEVRADIAWALGQIRDDAAIPHLIEMIKDEKDAFAQMYAAHAVQRMGLRALIELCEAMREQDKRKRLNIVNTMRHIFKDKQTLLNVYSIVISQHTERRQILRRYLVKMLKRRPARN